MKAVNTLPEGYQEIYSVNLQKDKKTALLVNGLSLLIGIIMAVPMHFVVPVTTLFDMEKGLIGYIIKMAVCFILMLVYLVLHELVHGIAMKICGTKKIKYGFTGLYAFAGSDDYYAKKPYIFIALAPIVFWGIVIAIITPMVSTSWFWVVYIVQIINVSGAAGDIFVTAKFSRFPKDILVQDHGVGMVVYSKSGEEQISATNESDNQIDDSKADFKQTKSTTNIKKAGKILLTVISVLSFICLAFWGCVYYFGGLSYLYYGSGVVIDICIFVAVAILIFALLIAGIVMMFRSKKIIRIICAILIVIFIPVAFYFSYAGMLISFLFGSNGCSYTEDINNYGKYDREYNFSYFPESVTDDMTVVNFSYYHKYIDVYQDDIYLEVTFENREIMDEYLTTAKNSFSEKGYLTYQNPYNQQYTDIVENDKHTYSDKTVCHGASINFRGDEDYRYVDMWYKSITYSYDELTIIYNYTSIGSDIEVGNNPDEGEYYPKYLERFGVEWNEENSFNYEYVDA